MNNMTRRFSFCAAIVALALSSGIAAAQDCKPQHVFKTVKEGYLTVAVTTLAPFSYLDGDTLKGIDGDIAAEFAKRECLKMNPVQVDPAAAIQSVVSGQADITVGNWYRTEKRSKVLNMSYPLYLDQSAIISKDGYKTVKEFEGKNVGTVQGYLFVDDLKKILGDNLKLYPNAAAVFDDMKAGRLDAAIDGYAGSVEAVKAGALAGLKVEVMGKDERVKASLEPGQATFPYAFGAEEFGAALDAVLQDMQKEGLTRKIIEQNGLDGSAGDTGAPRML